MEFWWESLLPGVLCLFHLLACPYTKVEESFNLQATHDLLYHGTQLDKYDHVEFPGVVPRTFLGPLSVATLSYPFVRAANYFSVTKFVSQYIVRAVLGLLVCVSFAAFYRAARHKLGSLVGSFLVLITCCQFHLFFYASRPLPNIFALVLALFSFRFWLLQQHGCFIWTSGAAIILFRSELSILLGIILLMEMVSRRLSIGTAVCNIVIAGPLLLGLTVLVDSVFWGRWVWPEGEVLWYNAVENKSHLWGTSPFWWYFISALPRAMLLPFLSLPWALYRERQRAAILALPAVGFILIYSLLPHKELRFIIYSIPLLNLVAACGYANIWLNRKKLPLLVTMVTTCSLILSFGMSLCFLHVSRHNYPGGHALSRLHQLVGMEMEREMGGVKVHIGVEAAMTGVSRFGELRPSWNYSKTEGLDPLSEELLTMNCLLISTEDYHHYQHTHRVVAKAEGLARLVLNWREFPPVKIQLRDKILVIMRDSDTQKTGCPSYDDINIDGKT